MLVVNFGTTKFDRVDLLLVRKKMVTIQMLSKYYLKLPKYGMVQIGTNLNMPHIFESVEQIQGGRGTETSQVCFVNSCLAPTLLRDYCARTFLLCYNSLPI